MDLHTTFLFTLTGSLLQELLHLKQRQSVLTALEEERWTKARGRIALSVATILLPSFAAALVYAGQDLDEMTLMILGAAFPSLFKKSVATVTGENSPTFGHSEKSTERSALGLSETMKTYLKGA